MSATLKQDALTGVFQAGATVITHLIDKQVECGPLAASLTETSLVPDAQWVMLLTEIPAAGVKLVVRFGSQATMEIVKIMMGGGEELGNVGASMISEITAQIASTMAEQIATQNGWDTQGIAAKLCDDPRLLPPPPMHTCTASFAIEGGTKLSVAIDMDVPAAMKAELLNNESSAQTKAEEAAGVKSGRSPKTPHAAAFSEMTPNVNKIVDGASLDFVRDVPMRVRALLGSSRLQLREVVGMQAGTVFELNRTSEEPIDLYVNNILIARGEVVVVDDRYAVKISELNPGSNAAA